MFRLFFGATNANDVQVALTGVAATGAVGTVSAQPEIPLSGVEITGAVGTVTAGADVAVALTGVAGVVSVGTVSPGAPLTVALTGVEATGLVGSVGVILPVISGTYRHTAPTPINGKRPQRLKDLERILETMERRT